MKNENTTISLIDILVEKHSLNKQKVIDYIVKNGNNRPFKLFLSGFMFELSVNQNNLKTKLS